MAVTPVGNPYVESSDLVANYPGASEALAERIDIVGVNPFADSAARATAIPSPTEGMMSSLNDTDAVERYDGATWKPVGGKVLQVVMATHSTAVVTTSTSFVTTGLSAAITPSSATSKVLIMSTTTGYIDATQQIYLNVFRGTVAGTNLSTTDGMAKIYSSAGVILAPMSLNYLDSPSTAASQTYTIGFRVSGGTGRVQFASAMSTIILIEVAA